jgi:hypothetical protein
MALSFTQSTGDGVNRNFSVGFQYLAKSHVTVRVDGTPAAFTWLNPSMVTTAVAPPAGAVVQVQRVTPRDTILVDFVDGSTLTETDLDTATLQTFFLSQEAFDMAGGTLSIESDGSYSATNRRIANVGAPQLPGDAVNKAHFEGTFLPQMSALLTQTTGARDTAVSARDTTNTARDATLVARDQAQAHRTAAGVSETNAGTHATNSASSATASQTARTGAETARTESQTARDSASGHRLNAFNYMTTTEGYRATTLTYRNEAEGFRNQSEQFALQAQASANQAALFDPSSYYTKTQSDARYPLTSHTHTAAQITGTFDIARLPVAPSGTSNTTQVVRADDSRLSNARTPTAHTHTIANVTNLQTELDNRVTANFGNTRFNRDSNGRLAVVNSASNLWRPFEVMGIGLGFFDSNGVLRFQVSDGRVNCLGWGSRGTSGTVMITPNDSVANATRAAGYIEWTTDVGQIGTNYFLSDERRKDNIAPSKVTAANTINAINLIQFDWKPDTGEVGHVDCGVSAQQLRTVNARYVRELGDGTLMVHEPALIPVLIKALQEALHRISELENK